MTTALRWNQRWLNPWKLSLARPSVVAWSSSQQKSQQGNASASDPILDETAWRDLAAQAAQLLAELPPRKTGDWAAYGDKRQLANLVKPML